MSATASTERRARERRGGGARSIALPAVFAALAAALGFALAPVPNVELVTLAVFASGVALGRVKGAVVGAVAMGVYSGLSPNGSGLAVPPLFVAQVLSMAVVGLAGGATAGFWVAPRRPPWSMALVGCAVGVVLTLLYQSAVIMGLAVAMPEFNEGFRAAVAANVFFSAIHLVSNGVIFAVLAPVLLPRLRSREGRARGAVSGTAAALAFALLALSCGSQARADGGAPADALGAVLEGPDEAATLVDTLAVEPPFVQEPSGNAHQVLSDGVADMLARAPTVRLTGARWHGHRASVARGALPASLTRVVLNGRDFSTWLSGGIDVLAGTGGEGTPLYLPDGPDLTLWPAYGPVDAGEFEGPGLPRVDIRRWYDPPPRPYGRLSMLSGALGQRAVGAEFGRQYADGVLGLTGALELRSGRAPVVGGAYDYTSQGGRFVLAAGPGWRLSAEGGRATLDRDVPGTGGSEDISTLEILSTVGATIEAGGASVRLFHDDGWLAVRRPGLGKAAAALVRDGASATIETDAWPVDDVTLVAATRHASGSALASSERVYELAGIARRELQLSDAWRLGVSGGWSQLAGEGYPVVDAGVVRLLESGPRASSLYLKLSAGGRHATSVERLLIARAPEGAASVSGDPSLEPTGAVSLRAGWDGSWRLGTAGVEGEVARLLHPISVDDYGNMTRLDNAADETVSSLSLWSSTGDTLRRGVSASAQLRSIDPSGSVVAREPVASVEADLKAWVSHKLFARGYLDVRWEVSASYETGLARGPWSGLVDDDVVTVSVLFAAEADQARVYALLEDAFDSAPERVPGYPGAGRAFSAGFSWSFWN